MTSFPTIASAARDIAAKRVSPVELMKDHLARSEKLNPALHAFIRFTPDIALEPRPPKRARQPVRCAGRLMESPLHIRIFTKRRGSPPRAIPACWNIMCPRRILPWCGAGAKRAR